MRKKGAYLLYIDLQKRLTLNVGKSKHCILPPGHYVYVGSAANGLDQRIARHRRLAAQKAGKLHWHIDFLLTHPKVRFIGAKKLAGSSECNVSHSIASRRGTTVPVPGFGSTDCREGCQAHLYRVGFKKMATDYPDCADGIGSIFPVKSV